MQRWIVIGAVAMILLLGGGGFAYWNYKQNLPNPVWVPLPTKPEMTDGQREKFAKELKAKLIEPETLTKISKELNLAQKWKMASDETAAAEISKRLFVRPGEADLPTGRIPSMNIGVDGPRKDAAVSGEIALRLMEEVRTLLGIKPPPEKPF